MWRGLRNSFIVAIPSTFLPIFIASLGAYGFARFRFPMRDYLFLAIVLFMAIPQQMFAIPIFVTMINAGLWDTFLGVLPIHSAWVLLLIFLFLRNFFPS